MNQQEILASQTNAENQDKPNSNSEILKRKKIQDTPFWIVGNDEQGYFLAMGINRISEILPTPEEVEKYLSKNMWDVITKIMIVMIKELPEYIKLTEKYDYETMTAKEEI